MKIFLDDLMKEIYMPTEYIIDNKKEFEVFLKAEKVLKNRRFVMMSNFTNEEIDFWKKTAKKYLKKNEKIIEMGCGSGRVIKEIVRVGFSADGFDNNIFFVKYCKKRNLNSFYLDAIKSVPKKYKSKYKIAGIAVNTLFNFPKRIRRKWISSAYDLLKKGGILIMSVYSDAELSRRALNERVKFYENILMTLKGYRVEFFDNGKRKGIRLIDNRQKEIWFSEWVSKSKLSEEIASWKKFRIVSIKLMKCGIGWKVVLIKR